MPSKICSWTPQSHNVKHPYIIHDAICLREYNYAILVMHSSAAIGQCIPKSQVSIHSPVKHTGDAGDLHISPWYAGKHGLINLNDEYYDEGFIEYEIDPYGFGYY